MKIIGGGRVNVDADADAPKAISRKNRRKFHCHKATKSVPANCYASLFGRLWLKVRKCDGVERWKVRKSEEIRKSEHQDFTLRPRVRSHVLGYNRGRDSHAVPPVCQSTKERNAEERIRRIRQRRDKEKNHRGGLDMTTMSVTRQGSEYLYMRCFPFLTYRCSGPFPPSLLPSFPRNAGLFPEDNHNAVRTYTGRH